MCHGTAAIPLVYRREIEHQPKGKLASKPGHLSSPIANQLHGSLKRQGKWAMIKNSHSWRLQEIDGTMRG